MITVITIIITKLLSWQPLVHLKWQQSYYGDFPVLVLYKMRLQTYLDTKYRADARFVPSHWEMSLQSNAISHWLIYAQPMRDDKPRISPRFAPSQWETSLQSNAVSHWLGANLESTLKYHFTTLSDCWCIRWLYDSTGTDLLCVLHGRNSGPATIM